MLIPFDLTVAETLDRKIAVPMLLAYPDMTSLENAQGGARFTTTLGGRVDLGAQYFYGYLPTPAVAADPSSRASTFAPKRRRTSPRPAMVKIH